MLQQFVQASVSSISDHFHYQLLHSCGQLTNNQINVYQIACLDFYSQITMCQHVYLLDNQCAVHSAAVSTTRLDDFIPSNFDYSKITPRVINHREIELFDWLPIKW